MTVTWWKVWERLVEKGQLSPKALLRREKNKRHPWRPRVRRGMRAWRAAREDKWSRRYPSFKRDQIAALRKGVGG